MPPPGVQRNLLANEKACRLRTFSVSLSAISDGTREEVESTQKLFSYLPIPFMDQLMDIDVFILNLDVRIVYNFIKQFE